MAVPSGAVVVKVLSSILYGISVTPVNSTLSRIFPSDVESIPVLCSEPASNLYLPLAWISHVTFSLGFTWLSLISQLPISFGSIWVGVCTAVGAGVAAAMGAVGDGDAAGVGDAAATVADGVGVAPGVDVSFDSEPFARW